VAAAAGEFALPARPGPAAEDWILQLDRTP
jgi:hypothetical protein